MKSQVPPHQTLNFALRSKKTSRECFYAVYVAQAQKLLLRVRFLFTNDNQFGNLLWKEFKTWGKEFAGSYSSKNHQVR